MRSNGELQGDEAFLTAVNEFAASFEWRVDSFTRDGELVALAALDHDRSFEQVLWVCDTKRASVRCLLVCRGSVPPEREASIIELCARINDGLIFGCAEYGFDERVLVFRDSFLLGTGRLLEALTGTSARLLDLGSTYSPAVLATLAGASAADAISGVPGSR